jgi:hypothetical protein
MSAHLFVFYFRYGMLRLSVSKRIEDANRFGQLALRLLSMYKMDEYLPRVYAAVYGVIETRGKPLKETFEPLMKAHKVGLLTGDTEFAALNANIYCFYKMWAGTSLQEVEGVMLHFKGWMKAQKHESALKFSEPCLRTVQVLMGKSSEQVDGSFLEKKLENAIASKNSSVITGVFKQRMILNYLFGNFKEAAEAFVDTGIEPPHFGSILDLTFKALTCLALARQGIDRRAHLRTVRGAIKELQRCSKQCPQNFSDKLFLVEGELASVLGKREEAYEKLICASGMASASDFKSIDAIALERMGWHLIRLPNADIKLAQSYFDKACARWEEWGALAKAKHLREEVAFIMDPTSASGL